MFEKIGSVVSQASVFGASWQGSLGDLAHIIQQIKHSRAFGRLSLRNSERLSVIHFYFRAGKLMHHVSNRSDLRSTLSDLQEWTRGFARFDRGITTREVTLNDEHERLLDQTLAYMCHRGVVIMPSAPRVIEGNIIATRGAKELITPFEWQVLVEATRRVSLAVARLVGPREALNVLQDILDDCSSAFPAFASVKIAPSGYLQITDRSQLDSMSRKDLLEGFTALIATCQLFCSPLVGEREAHRLILQAVREIGPSLANLGVFAMEDHQFSSSSFSS